ncbi:MAG: hypothetical protein KIT10_14405 [Flavobacteriales bacterium]|nr:hypothetical protein [Flavobacteriales bacterium]
MPIHFSTSDTLRMRINPYLPSVDVGEEWPGQNLSGFVGIGDFSTTVVNRPVSLLHLDHKGGVLVGWRPWMRTGTLCTLGSDLMYVGTKQEAPDRVDAVIAWADNVEDVSAFGPDALRFIFTRAPYQTGAAADTNGLEIARMIPDTTGNEGFLGLGDFFNAGTQPDEKLDLLDRTIRLRDFVHPTLYRNDSQDRVLVADSTDGRVFWRPLNGLTDCASGWAMNGADPVTAYNGHPCPPQAINRVGIGLAEPLAKLHVLKVLSNALQTERAGFFHIRTAAPVNIGMDGLSDGSETNVLNVGGRGNGTNSPTAYGLWGIADSPFGGAKNIGVKGDAMDGQQNYGRGGRSKGTSLPNHPKNPDSRATVGHAQPQSAR